MIAGKGTVQEVLESYKRAVYEQDVEAYVSLYASDFHVYDCWDDWECTELSQWTASTKEWFEGLREEDVLLHVEYEDVAVEESSSLAFVRCNVTFAAYNQSGEKLRQITNRFTFGLRNENGSWSIAHQHSSLPIHGETGKGIFTRK